MKKLILLLICLLTALLPARAVFAGSIDYIIMPFSGDDVQTLDIYTGQSVYFKCDITGGLYTWYKRAGTSGGGSIIYYEEPQPDNTYKLTSRAAYYYQNYMISVTAEKDGETFKSKTYKINVIYSKGDINGDGYIDKEDASLLLKYLCGAETLDEKQLAAAKLIDETKQQPDLRDVIWILKQK